MSKSVICGGLGIHPDKATTRAFERAERQERKEEEARLPPIKRVKMSPRHVELSIGNFSLVVFTNDQGLCVQLRSDAQRPCETPLDEMQRAWNKLTA